VLFPLHHFEQTTTGQWGHFQRVDIATLLFNQTQIWENSHVFYSNTTSTIHQIHRLYYFSTTTRHLHSHLPFSCLPTPPISQNFPPFSSVQYPPLPNSTAAHITSIQGVVHTTFIQSLLITKIFFIFYTPFLRPWGLSTIFELPISNYTSPYFSPHFDLLTLPSSGYQPPDDRQSPTYGPSPIHGPRTLHTYSPYTTIITNVR
jgi:hypothetical protein